MECRTCFESLTALIDGEVEASETTAIRQHLDACPACQDQYDSLLYAARLVDALPEPRLQTPSFAEFERKLPRGGPLFFDWWGMLVPRWVPAAAFATLLMVISFPFYWTSSSERVEMERMFANFIEEREQEERQHLVRMASEERSSISPNPFSRRVSLRQDNPFSLR